MQVHLAKGDLVPTPCMQFKLEEKMINNIRCRLRNPRPLPLKNFLLRYAGVRLSLGFALSFLTTDPSLFISVQKGHCQLDKAVLQPYSVTSCYRHFSGKGIQDFRFELIALWDMTQPTFHSPERKILGLWKKQWDQFSVLRDNCRIHVDLCW